jgi:hypothetical protein
MQDETWEGEIEGKKQGFQREQQYRTETNPNDTFCTSFI